MGCFLFDYKIRWLFRQELYVFEAKKAFVIQNLVIWGLVWGG